MHTASDMQHARQYWDQVLDYAIKMLLYLTVRDAQVVHDRAYTDAPRTFSGLGKRKRAERLAEIELLCDRHFVGPAILYMELPSGLPSDGAIEMYVATGSDHISRCSRTGRIRRCVSWHSLGRRLCGQIG